MAPIAGLNPSGENLPHAVRSIVDAIDAARDHSLSQASNAVLAGWGRGVGGVRALYDAGIPIDQIQRLAYIHLGYEFVRLDPSMVKPDALARVNLPDVYRLKAIPYHYEAGVLTIAVADPLARGVTDEVMQWDHKVSLAVAEPQAIDGILSWLEDQQRLAEMEDDEDDFDDDVDEEEDDDQGRFSVIARQIVEQAIVAGASDIHIEPEETQVRVRYRIDGVLHNRGTYPASMTQGLINRFKVKAKLDLGNNNRTPQDGRFTAKLSGHKIDMRVAICPTIYGAEMCVMRLLDTGRVELKLASLLQRSAYVGFKKAIERPYGMVLVTGPTGSGKSTMLAAALSDVTEDGVKVCTAEDPVEYRIKGACQVEVNPKRGLTFPAALKSFLRSDPDIILIGEIRDGETGSIATTAALTGHLVLASLHVDTSFACPARLTDMGIEPFLVSSTLNGVLNQRLARRVCTACRQPMEPTEEFLESVGWPLDKIEVPEVVFQKGPEGCERCGRTGYRGRMSITEYLAVDNDDIRRAIIERAPSDVLEKIARERGAFVLYEDGLDAVAQGLTTVEELLRVVAVAG